MLVYFYTDWCPYCRSLDGVFQSKNFRTRYASMVKVKINPETGWREHALADRFHIELRNAVKEQPDVVAFDYLAWIALDKEDWSEALDWSRKLVEADPDYDHGRGYYLRAVARWHLGDTFEASRDADQGCSMGDKDACEIKAQLQSAQQRASS